MFWDGVRLALEMLDISHARLLDELEATANDKDEAAANHIPRAMLDAWSIVDSAHRLRFLLRELPRLKQNTPPMRAIYSALEPSEALRHSVQHLQRDITRHAQSETPTWGTLSWQRMDSETDGRGFIMIPGGTRTLKDLGGLMNEGIRENPDHVILRAFGAQLDLSGTYRAVRTFTRALERSLETTFAELTDRAGSDMVVTIVFSVDEPDSQAASVH